ncbi:hypothetical protein HPB48_022848 [Haemaphysalis longicornis]|uniref:Uncharacterized protein n=1 Tax=Haemaphysalis longicornis TaxID=44386 RepID=A0A9J6FMW9_HAELO|nr:hypothetical protein HPB48_022848 [Haemaphysalis longicornis]
MTCPRCSASVLNKDLPNHCRNGCPGKAIALAAEQPTERQGVEISAEDIAASLDELKALILDPNEDRLPALQSKINEVLEQARNIASQTKAIPTSLQEGDRSIQQTSGELSRTFRRELQSEESALCGNQKEHFQTQEILEQVKCYGKELDAVSRKLSDSENRLSNQLVQATQKLSETFVEEVRSQLTGLCAHLKKHLPINEISEQGKGHGMQVDAIASTLIESERRISDQLAKAAQELSATLVQNFESQQRELSDLLEAMFEEERSYAGEEEAATPYELPWRSEKKLILRKLELIGGETLAYLELLRTSADQQLKRPLVENTPVLPGYVSTPLKPPLIEQGEIKEFCYIVSITNVDDVVRSEKFIWLFTRWYHRDRYLQVTAHGLDLESSSGLAVCLKWGTTELNHFFLFPEAIVYVQHPDNVEESNLLLTRIGGAFGPWEFFLSDEAFLVEWEKVSSLGLVRGGKLTLVVAFRK